jgi:hypothetical protein
LLTEPRESHSLFPESPKRDRSVRFGGVLAASAEVYMFDQQGRGGGE